MHSKAIFLNANFLGINSKRVLGSQQFNNNLNSKHPKIWGMFFLVCYIPIISFEHSHSFHHFTFQHKQLCFFFFFKVCVCQGGLKILSLPVLPIMTGIMMEGLYGGLNLSFVPEVCRTKLGGILYSVQGTGFKTEIPTTYLSLALVSIS